MYPRIDTHTHILPSNLPEDYYKNYSKEETYVHFKCCNNHAAAHDGGNINTATTNTDPTRCNVKMYKGDKFFREVEPNCFQPLVRMEDMEKTDVTVQVLSTVPVMFSYWDNKADAVDLSRRINDELIEIVTTYPTKFLALATLPMTHIDAAIEELERVMKIPGVIGIEVGSNIKKKQLSDVKFEPIWKKCEELNAAVFVHPWQMPREKYVSKYWLPWLVSMPAETSMAICSFIFSGLLDRYPKLRVMFAHGGGSFAGTLGRIEHGFNCRPDLVAVDNPNNPRDYCQRFFVDSLVHDESGLRLIMEIFGDDNIVLGSDYPFPLGELEPGKLVVNTAVLTEEQKRKILWNNAFKWMGINDQQFMMTPALVSATTSTSEAPTSSTATTTTPTPTTQTDDDNQLPQQQ